MVDVEELEMPIGEMRGYQVDDNMECVGQLCAGAGDEAQDLNNAMGPSSRGPCRTQRGSGRRRDGNYHYAKYRETKRIEVDVLQIKIGPLVSITKSKNR